MEVNKCLLCETNNVRKYLSGLQGHVPANKSGLEGFLRRKQVAAAAPVAPGAVSLPPLCSRSDSGTTKLNNVN